MVVMVVVDRLGRHVMMMMVVVTVVVDGLGRHVVMVVMMMMVDRRRFGRSSDRRNSGETDNHRRGDQQFLKHSLSP